jgi:hypothetical protein
MRASSAAWTATQARDIALRDFGLSLGTLALARLAEAYPATRPRAATSTMRG